MSGITSKELLKMSDQSIVQLIGDFVRHHRLEQNKSQVQLAAEAGINRATISELEKGGRCNLLTLIRILRTLHLMHVLTDFEVKAQVSPILLAEMEMSKRQRASKVSASKRKPQSDW
jgi:putative transcriptional regulator